MNGEWVKRGATEHFKGLGRLFNNKLYSDVDVGVGYKNFRCHRVILAAASDYFHAMFTSGMKECLEGVISLHDIGVECFEQILEYIYTLQMPLNEDNALETMCAADMLQIPCLKECCEDFLTKHLTVNNCVKLFQQAKLRHCATLEKQAKHFILANFVDLDRSGYISNLDEQEFSEILADNHLNIPNESYAFRAADKWLRAKPERVHKHLLKIFESIRLPRIALDILVNVIQVTDYVKNNPEVQEIVINAVRYHVTPAIQQGFISGNIERRSSSNQEMTLICLQSSDIKVFDRQKGVWYTRNMAESTYRPSQNEETYHCMIGNEYYLVNRARIYSTLYVADENKVIKIGPHSQTGDLFGIVGVENAIYSIFYDNGRTNLVKIDSKTRSLTNVFSSKAGIHNAGVAVLRQNIFVFGGTIGSGASVSTIHRFNVLDNTDTIVGNLPMALSCAKATPYGSTIYIVTLDGNILEFSETQDASVVAKIRDFSAKGLDLVVYKKKILIFARRKSEVSSDDSVQLLAFDPTTKNLMKTTWPGLSEKMTNFAIIVVPKRQEKCNQQYFY